MDPWSWALNNRFSRPVLLSIDFDYNNVSLWLSLNSLNLLLLLRDPQEILNLSFLFQNAKFPIYQHKSLEERIEVAKILAERFPRIPVYADNMNNEANKAFGAMPERLFILLNNEVVYEGGMGPFFYNLDEVKDWLVTFTEKINNNNDQDCMNFES